MRILLTGGCGFIGSNFVRLLLRERPDYSLVNLDNLSYSGNPENLRDIEDDSRYSFVHGDICDPSAVAKAMQDCDAVVHMAAESHVDRSIEDATPFVRTNVLGTQVMLEAARRTPGVRFVHVSTDEVYGSLPLENKSLLFTESTPLSPRSPYAASKAGSDHLALAYHETYSMDIRVTRCSNNFGPYQYPEKVIPRFVTNLMEGQKVPLYGDGLNVRDWLHVEDHCEAVLRVLEDGRSGEIYNIGGNNERSNKELTHQILAAMGKDDAWIQYVEDRLGHDRRYAIDASKIKRELGWAPTRSAWPSALEQTVRWYQDNKAWWAPLREAQEAAK